MSKDLNKCMFIGRLGKDVEVKYSPAGVAIASLSIAVGDDYKDKNTGQKVERTEWVRCIAFNRLAEIMGQYLKKGSKVYIEGRLQTRKYEKDGQTHYSTEIVANEMQMLDSNGQQDGNRPSENAGRQEQDDYGEIPF